MDKEKKIATNPYKGTRDFYPENLASQKYVFNKIRQTVESFGYEEYNTPTIEPTELYQAKSGDEIVNEQTYSFQDRGERNVTLRPEMTPGVARLVAQKRRELAYPLRWYSLQNFFRYERPQKGRGREFWQLNTDIFGVANLEAEAEIIYLGYQIMQSLGATAKDFVIKISSAKLLEKIYQNEQELNLNQLEIKKILRLLDLKAKITPDEYKDRWLKEFGEEKGLQILNKEQEMIEKAKESPQFQPCLKLSEKLEQRGVKIETDPQLLRGFDYYTGIVFEFFDSNPENKRALFGGGRYDNLLDIFGSEKIPAVGFGLGDMTLFNFLKTRNLFPAYQPTTQLFICPLSAKYFTTANQLADSLRKEKLNVAVNYSEKKIGDQIALANKKKIPYVICLGEDEAKTNKYKLKNLQTGKETSVRKAKKISSIIKNKIQPKIK